MHWALNRGEDLGRQSGDKGRAPQSLAGYSRNKGPEVGSMGSKGELQAVLGSWRVQGGAGAG